MGRLIGLDTSVFIYLLHERSPYHGAATKIWTRIERGPDRALFSQIGMVELLTGPKKQGRPDLAQQYRDLFGSIARLAIVGLTHDIVEIASDLRAKYGVRTPDAIHVATAIVGGADRFITNDRRLSRITEIKIQSLSTRS